MSRHFLLILLAAVPLCFSCKGDEPAKKEEAPKTITLSLSDADATPETKALYSNLWAIKSKGWMFGHQNDLLNGRSWKHVEVS